MAGHDNSRVPDGRTSFLGAIEKGLKADQIILMRYLKKLLRLYLRSPFLIWNLNCTGFPYLLNLSE
jgi:hypothetical protein